MIVRKKKQRKKRFEKHKKSKTTNSSLYFTKNVQYQKPRKTVRSSKMKKKKRKKERKNPGKTESKLHIEYSNRNKPSEEKAKEGIEQEVLES